MSVSRSPIIKDGSVRTDQVRIVDEGMTVQRMISGLEEAEEGEATDKQVGTWM